MVDMERRKEVWEEEKERYRFFEKWVKVHI